VKQQNQGRGKIRESGKPGEQQHHGGNRKTGGTAIPRREAVKKHQNNEKET